MTATNRQLKAVTEAIYENVWSHPDHDDCKIAAQAAIDASDAKYVPMLVEALKLYASIANGLNGPNGVAYKALQQLPEDLR